MTAPHRALDTTANLTPFLPMLVREGITDVSQYLRAGGLTKARADAIRAAGINLILNFEGAGDNINAFSAATGARDATYAMKAAQALGAPVGTAIYFSCEPLNYGDLTSAYNSRVLPYWRAVRGALGTQYRTGAYTFGTWLDWLLRDAANEFCWLPNASRWPGYHDFLASNRWHFHQIPGGSNTNFHGLVLDWDDVNPTMADIGAWKASGQAAPTPAPDQGPDTDHPTISRGDSGPAVIALQNYLGIDADGQFGPATEAAVKAFQAEHTTSADGIVGPETWSALQAQQQGV